MDKAIKDILEDKVEEKYYINKPFNLVDKGHQAELDIKGMDCIKRVYGINNVSPALTTMGGGLREPKILCYVERTPLKFLNRNGKKVDGDYTFCVDTCHTGGIKEIYDNNDFRIRKLTPRECFRLMGMNEADINKIQQTGLSNAQQYKMAGNSIVVQVLEGIFRNLFL